MDESQRLEEMLKQGDVSSALEDQREKISKPKKESDTRVKEKKIELVNNALEWTKNEEMALLSAIKKYGLFDLENLMKCIPSKRKESICLQIKLSAIRARAAFRNAQKNVKRVYRGRESNESVPVQEWLKIFEQIQPVKANHLTMQRAFTQPLLFISQFEQITPPENCGGVDLRELYKYLYHACLGLPYKDINSNSMDFLFYTLKMLNHEMAKYSADIEQHLSETDFFSATMETNQQMKSKVDSDVSAVYQEPVLNPFGLPEQLFHPADSERAENNS